MRHPGIDTDVVRVNNLCHYIPPRDGFKNGSNDPQLILIFGWMGAYLPQLMKYCAKYSNAYPSAGQVLIQSDVVAGITGIREVNLRRQRPILKLLSELGLFNEKPPRVLLHVFSGGGSSQLLWLALAIETMPLQAQTSCSPTCLVLDSTPGAFRHSDLRRVFLLGVTGFRRLAGETVASLVYCVLKASSAISGRPTTHDFIRDGLNNPQIFPWMDGTSPRLYLYSDGDQLVHFDDVRQHITAAKAKGLNVRAEEFVGSPHVQHSRMHPDRYWAAVHTAWGQAVRSKL
ncbi:hypothetical protein C8J57DRAFT_1186301 [Mycena rebaudengoi]|nr:hypothetical protein C8J57DRAFT_1186301 [Mycena rebaudengoi]